MREQPSKSYSSFYSKRFCQLLQALSLLTVAYHSEVRFTGPQKLRRSPQGEITSFKWDEAPDKDQLELPI